MFDTLIDELHTISMNDDTLDPQYLCERHRDEDAAFDSAIEWLAEAIDTELEAIEDEIAYRRCLIHEGVDVEANGRATERLVAKFRILVAADAHGAVS